MLGPAIARGILEACAVFGIGATQSALPGWWSTDVTIFTVLLCMVIAAILTWLLILLRRHSGTMPFPYGPSRAKALWPSEFDQEKFDVYADALRTLCLGAGIEKPRLHVVDSFMPIAYLARLGFIPGIERYLNKRTALVITTALLKADFKRDEIEAIVAVLLAKKEFNREIRGSSVKHIQRLADKVSISEVLLEEISVEFGLNWLFSLILFEDTWAVRLTGSPGSLKRAIRKSAELLDAYPARGLSAELTVFTEPPHHCEYPRFFRDPLRYDRDVAIQELGALRDKLIEYRIKNLDLIQQGVRQPYQQVRGGVPVTEPEAWE